MPNTQIVRNASGNNQRPRRKEHHKELLHKFSPFSMDKTRTKREENEISRTRLDRTPAIGSSPEAPFIMLSWTILQSSPTTSCYRSSRHSLSKYWRLTLTRSKSTKSQRTSLWIFHGYFNSRVENNNLENLWLNLTPFTRHDGSTIVMIITNPRIIRWHSRIFF